MTKTVKAPRVIVNESALRAAYVRALRAYVMRPNLDNFLAMQEAYRAPIVQADHDRARAVSRAMITPVVK